MTDEQRLSVTVRKQYPSDKGRLILSAVLSYAKEMDLFSLSPEQVDIVAYGKRSRISIYNLQALSCLGYDVSKYEEEMNMYKKFTTEYKTRYKTRANIQNVYNIYFLKLKRAFPTFEGLTVDDVKSRIDEMIFPDIKTLKRVLDLMGAPDNVISEKQLLAGVRAEEIYSEMVKISKSGNTTFNDGKGRVLIFMDELNEFCQSHEIDTLSFKDGMRFISGRYKLCFPPKKLLFLRACGWPHSDAVDAYKTRVEHDLIKIQSFKTKPSFALATMEAHVGTIDKVKLMDEKEIIQKLKGVNIANGFRNLVYKLIVFLRPELELSFVKALPHKMTQITRHELFRKTATEFDVQLFDRVFAELSEDSRDKTSCTETHHTKLLYQTTVVFDDMIEYAKPQSLRHFIYTFTLDDVKEFLVSTLKSLGVMNDRVKNQHDNHHAKRYLFCILRVLKSSVISTMTNVQMNSIIPQKILNKVENKRLTPNETRRGYTTEEIDSLLYIVEDDAKWTLIITLFKEVGLRVGGLCNLRWGDMVDSYGVPKHQCKTIEKGNRQRFFVTGPNLKRKMLAYIATFRNDKGDLPHIDNNAYFFNVLDPTKRPSVTSIEQKLKRISQEAGIVDVDVHPHLFRHTLVSRLEDEGNSLAVISKFIGHNSVDTTNTWYSLRKIENIAETLKNPFFDVVNEEEEFDETEATQLKLETCVGIISGIFSILKESEEGRMHLLDIDVKMPGIDKIMRRIVDSTAGSTISSFV